MSRAPSAGTAEASAIATARAAIVVFVVLLAVYLPAAPRDVGEGDVAKFQMVGAVLGTPHPTGYPLYVLALHGWLGLLGGGAVAWKANLLSALLSALAGAVIALAAARGLGVRPWVAALAGLLFGLAPEVRRGASVAEVYPLHALLVAGILGALMLAARGGRARWLVGATIGTGLALAHHATAVFLLPSLVLAARARTAKRVLSYGAWGLLLAVACAFALGPYAYLVERSFDPEVRYLEAGAASALELLDTLSGGSFRSNVGRLSWDQVLTDRLPWMVRAGLAGGGLLLPLGVAGFGLASRGTRGLLGVYLVGSALFLVLYTVSDLEAYLVAPFAALALSSAVVLERVAARLERRARPLLLAAAVGLAALAPALLLAPAAEPLVATTGRADRARAAIASAPPGAGLVVFGYQRAMTLEAIRLTESSPNVAGLVALPREAAEIRFLLGPLLRHLDGSAPLRVQPHDRPLASGAPLVLWGADGELRSRLASRGIEAVPVPGAEAFLLTLATGGEPAPPGAFVVRRLERERDLNRAVMRLKDPGFDPQQVAFHRSVSAEASGAVGSVTGVLREADRIVVEIESGSGWLVLQEPLRGRWRLRVDGVDRGGLRVDGNYPAVALVPAIRRVEWIRDHRPFRLWRWLRGAGGIGRS